MVKNELVVPLTSKAIFVAKEEYGHQSDHHYFVYLACEMF